MTLREPPLLYVTPFFCMQGAQTAEAAANHHSLVQGMFYEECDVSDEDATFFIFTNTTPEPQRVHEFC